MLIAPNLCTVKNLRFSPSDATVYAFCLQLIMQPQGKWVQRLDKTNTGVTVVARRVSRKLSVPKGGLWNPTTCWTIMWICKGKELQTYPRIKFSTLLSLSTKHAAPPSFSRLPACLRAKTSVWCWTTGIPWDEVWWFRPQGDFCGLCPLPCQVSFRKNNYNAGDSIRNTGRQTGNLCLVLQMAFVTSLDHRRPPLLVTAGHHLPSQNWSPSSLLKAWTKILFPLHSYLSTSDQASPITLPAEDGRCPYSAEMEWRERDDRRLGGAGGNPLTTSFLFWIFPDTATRDENTLWPW